VGLRARSFQAWVVEADLAAVVDDDQNLSLRNSEVRPGFSSRRSGGGWRRPARPIQAPGHRTPSRWPHGQSVLGGHRGHCRHVQASLMSE
jgi:hypothetical protein